MGLHTPVDRTGHLEIIRGPLLSLLSHHSLREPQLDTKGPVTRSPNFYSQILNFWSICIKAYLVIYKITNTKMEVKKMRL